MYFRLALTFINLVLITLLAYLGVSLGYQWLDTSVAVVAPRPVASRSQNRPSRRQIPKMADYRIIVERNLFGTKATKNVPPPQKIDLEGLRQTRLQLTLWGTVAGEGQKAYAVIEDKKTRQQRLYHVGDTVQNATVKMILREKVVLRVDGRDEILEMEKPKTGLKEGFVASSGAGNSRLTPRTRQKITLKRSMLENATRDVSKLMTQVNIRPYMENGQPAGLALSNIKPSSIFRRMGLRNGDVLVGVNGQEIRSLDDALGLYESLKTSSSVTVAIKRRGRLRAIEYNIR